LGVLILGKRKAPEWVDRFKVLKFKSIIRSEFSDLFFLKATPGFFQINHKRAEAQKGHTKLT